MGIRSIDTPTFWTGPAPIHEQTSAPWHGISSSSARVSLLKRCAEQCALSCLAEFWDDLLAETAQRVADIGVCDGPRLHEKQEQVDTLISEPLHLIDACVG